MSSDFDDSPPVRGEVLPYLPLAGRASSSEWSSNLASLVETPPLGIFFGLSSGKNHDGQVLTGAGLAGDFARSISVPRRAVVPSLLEEGGRMGNKPSKRSLASAGETMPRRGQTAYYTVANGDLVLRYYSFQSNESGEGGAEPEVAKFFGTCHKHFRTSQHAEAFIADREEMYACVVKPEIKDELSDGYGLAQMQGIAVDLSLIQPCCDGSDKFVQGIGSMETSG